jgi:hypothetical protein
MNKQHFVKETGGQQYYTSKTMFIMQKWYVMAWQGINETKEQNVFH